MREGIFVDTKGVNCTSLEIVGAKKYLTQNLFKAIADVQIDIISTTFPN